MGRLVRAAPEKGAVLDVAASRQALAAARTIAEAKEIGDKAKAVADYLRKQRGQWDAALDAEEIALEAHIRSAEILEEMRRKGKAGGRGRPRKGDGASPFRLRELLGVPNQDAAKKLAHRQKKAWRISDEEPERVKEYVRQQRESYGAITLSGLVDGKAHVSHNTGQIEWYTPPEYIAAAREVMGGIDVDPASSEIAQRAVQAKHYFTAKDDGLTKSWSGRVWMNPPYAAGLVDRFVEKLCSHVADGSVPQAVVLVNNATDTAWFQFAAKQAAAICFPSGRIRFIDENGNPGGAPLQGQAVLYFGRNFETFEKAFHFGFCVRI